MSKNILHGILFSGIGSLWWGVVGVLYFKSVSFVGPIELIVHRTVWTSFLLLFVISIYSKWNDVFLILKNIKKVLILFFCGILIVTNWFTWIYAVVTNRLVDASFGYYIFPILSVFFGIIFLKESHNKQKLLAISLVIISVVYLFFNFESIPWVGLIVAVSWSIYNLIRKKLKVPVDVGLFVESAFMTPFAIIVFYFLTKDGNNFFSPSDLIISFWLFLAGAMTLIPLYLYLKGVELAGLGPTAMIFFLAPTGQFLLGVFYYGEYLDINKLISFVIIWIAVIIYLHDLSREKVH
jgi:chloramphenicol-sensitive protein RarD